MQLSDEEKVLAEQQLRNIHKIYTQKDFEEFKRANVSTNLYNKHLHESNESLWIQIDVLKQLVIDHSNRVNELTALLNQFHDKCTCDAKLNKEQTYAV
jgi:hypothetical protein